MTDPDNQRDTEAELRASESRYRALFDTAADGIIVVTSDGAIESANNSAHRMFGYESGELINKQINTIVESVFGVFSGPGAASGTERLKTGEQRKFRASRETVGTRQNGERFPAEISLSVLNLGSSHVFVLVVRDVTERQRAQESQAYLAAIVESSGDAIIGKTVDGKIFSWNPAAQKLYGWSAADMLGQTMEDLILQQNRTEFARLLDNAVRGLKIEHFETINITKSGVLIDVELTISPVRNQSAQVVGVSIIARDVSMKRAAERRVSEFYSMVSHELRTPLTSIRASLGLLEGGVAGYLSEEAHQLVEIARTEADRLVRLINDILDLRKIEAGRLELRMQDINAPTLVKNVLTGLQHMAEEAGISLHYEPEDDLTVRCDRDRITQVLTNLVSNAVKFSTRGNPVTVRVNHAYRPGFVRFSVIDQGPGIALAEQHKLFGKFQQLDSSDTRPAGGTGLGLAISKAIIEQHGGRVGVSSDTGKGSTFWFDLPAQGLTGAGEKPVADGSSAQTILLVEDDHKLASVLEKLLHSQGYRVMHASSCQEAELRLEQFRPDLMLLDVILPDGNGIDLMQKVWARPQSCDIPVVVLSALGADEYTSPLLIDWIPKPFPEKRLRRALRNGLRHRPEQPVTVLVVEDEPATRQSIVEQVRKLGLHCKSAATGVEALSMATNEHPDLIILDVGIPAPDGFEIVQRLRQTRSLIPLLVYTGRDLNDDDKSQLTLGITRYITKSTASEADLMQTVSDLLSGLLESEE